MAIKVFDLDQRENPWQYDFFNSRNDINAYTGGYGNGKTAAGCIRALTVASTYENARCLVGRATRPKLEDSTKKEMLKWIPEDWVERWPSERRNDLILKKTHSAIEFRHVRLEGKGKGEEQSNLLSATYDYIFIDQFDDPEFGYKDFEDLIGRLRGTARYVGDDPTWPRVGPQMLDFTANPTRNWLFREIVSPYFTYKKTGFVTSKLLFDKENKRPILTVFNAPTRANKRNVGAKYEKRMETVFRGVMKKRFVDGDWDAYEGLIYPDYNDATHLIRSEDIREYVARGLVNGTLGIIEGYDYGQASPACYLLAFVDANHNVIVADGFYEAMKSVEWQAAKIKSIRDMWKVIPAESIYADPAIFKGRNATAKEIGKTIAELFADERISMQPGNNGIASGIEKVSTYMSIDKMHVHPITENVGSPRLYFNNELEFIQNEIADYYWNKNTVGQNVDKPIDKNDHSMDTLKYMFTHQAQVMGMMRRPISKELNPGLFMFHEMPDTDDKGKAPRYHNG